MRSRVPARRARRRARGDGACTQRRRVDPRRRARLRRRRRPRGGRQGGGRAGRTGLHRPGAGTLRGGLRRCRDHRSHLRPRRACRARRRRGQARLLREAHGADLGRVRLHGRGRRDGRRRVPGRFRAAFPAGVPGGQAQDRGRRHRHADGGQVPHPRPGAAAGVGTGSAPLQRDARRGEQPRFRLRALAGRVGDRAGLRRDGQLQGPRAGCHRSRLLRQRGRLAPLRQRRHRDHRRDLPCRLRLRRPGRGARHRGPLGRGATTAPCPCSRSAPGAPGRPRPSRPGRNASSPATARNWPLSCRRP